MKKSYQCLYTILLLITCFIASPLIFRQIWNSSKEVEPASSKKPPVIDINKTDTVTTENTSVPEFTDTDIPDTTEPTEEITTEPPEPVLSFVKSDPSYFDDALFIGDSRTVGIYEYGTLKNAHYFCSVGLASYKIENEYINGCSIYDMLSDEKYGKIYVMLGINEVGNDSDYTLNCFVKLLNTLKEYQPDALIYIMGNLHVTSNRQLQGDTITNENINNLNSAMSEFADGQKVFYLDVNQIFDDADGNLMSECSNDGVHVLAKYYQTWCDWLCLNTIPVDPPAEEDTDITDESSESYSDNLY
ncbi:MAG: lipase [Ruminococcus sp.]|nr:lipase [Ruminococcus sp.]